MGVSRRAFLKAATIAASMTSLLPFGKAAEQQEELPWTYDKEGRLCWWWNWDVSDWIQGRRYWSANITLPSRDDVQVLKPIWEHSLRTNQRAFCGVPKDHLLLFEMAWHRDKDKTTFATVGLVERRRAQGYVNIIDVSTGKRIKGRWRAYERANFQEIMPGQHRIVGGVDPAEWSFVVEPRAWTQYEVNNFFGTEA